MKLCAVFLLQLPNPTAIRQLYLTEPGASHDLSVKDYVRILQLHQNEQKNQTTPLPVTPAHTSRIACAGAAVYDGTQITVELFSAWAGGDEAECRLLESLAHYVVATPTVYLKSDALHGLKIRAALVGVTLCAPLLGATCPLELDARTLAECAQLRPEFAPAPEPLDAEQMVECFAQQEYARLETYCQRMTRWQLWMQARFAAVHGQLAWETVRAMAEDTRI